MQVKARGKLRLLNPPTKAKIANKMPVAQNLFSLAIQANNNMISILDKTKTIICKEDAIRITLTEPLVLSGHRASNGLWKVPIIQQSAPRINLDTYYYPKIANNIIPTYNNKFFWIFHYQLQHGHHKSNKNNHRYTVRCQCTRN